MASWQELADELKTDPILKDLSEAQVEAVIDVLVLAVHSKGSKSFMEEAELEHMLFELPWIKDKEDKVEAHIKEQSAKVEAAESDDALRDFAKAAATELEGSEVREKVYTMATTLAGADMEIHPAEQKVLNMIADEFEIRQELRSTP